VNKSSYVLAEEPATDLAMVQAMAAELEEYIVADELYRTITVRLPTGTQNIQMTGADLLTRLYRLRGERSHLSSSAQVQLDEVQQQVTQTIYSLRTRFHNRLLREIKTRLDSLKWFLDDCAADRKRCHVEFPFEMRNRQRIEEALKELDYQLDEELQKRLRQIDERIRVIAVAAPFLWDEKLRPLFPADTYWYLYRRPINLPHAGNQ
jgi:hypothetical protein